MESIGANTSKRLERSQGNAQGKTGPPDGQKRNSTVVPLSDFYGGKYFLGPIRCFFRSGYWFLLAYSHNVYEAVVLFSWCVYGESMSPKARGDGELKRLSAVELSGVVGIGASTIQKWRASYASFPPKDKSDQYCIRDAVIWWLCNKAPRAMMEAAWEKLGSMLGKESSSPVQGEQKPAGMPVVSGGASQEEFERHKRIMELRLKDAKLRGQLGELVSLEAVKDLMMGFAKQLRERELVLEKKTGEPILGTLEPAFDWLSERLVKLDLSPGMGIDIDLD